MGRDQTVLLIEAWFRGHRPQSRSFFADAAEQAERGDWPSPLARSVAFVAMRDLDDLSAPADALQLTRRSRAWARSARLGVGLHTMIAGTYEAEALLRLARFDEAQCIPEETSRTLQDAALPALALTQTQLRLFVITGQLSRLGELADTLQL